MLAFWCPKRSNGWTSTTVNARKSSLLIWINLRWNGWRMLLHPLQLEMFSALTLYWIKFVKFSTHTIKNLYLSLLYIYALLHLEMVVLGKKERVLFWFSWLYLYYFSAIFSRVCLVGHSAKSSPLESGSRKD